jgi:uncharacterized membrane protein
MEIQSIIFMSIKCWLSWIAVTYIANYLKLTRTHILEIYPFTKEKRWKSILLNLSFYWVLSLVICIVHIFIWSSIDLDESGYVSHMALFAAVLHGTLAAYLVFRDRSKKDRYPLAAVIMYWHLLCGLFLAFIMEMDILGKWLL